MSMSGPCQVHVRTITNLDHSLSLRLLKLFFDNILLEHVELICVLPLVVHQVEGVIPIHFHSLSFLVRGPLHA